MKLSLIPCKLYNRIFTIFLPLAVIVQELDYSFCDMQIGYSPIWVEIINPVQITLGAFMCLLIAIRFMKESLQMYNATKRFQLNCYMNLLAREGIIYFLAYVHASLFYLPSPKVNINLLWIASFHLHSSTYWSARVTFRRTNGGGY